MDATASTTYLSLYVRWLVVFWAVTLTSCTHLTRPTDWTTAPLAPALATKVFVQGDRGQTVESLSFDVPMAGKGLLKLVNAAKIGAAPSERVQGVEITLNGEVVVSPKSFNDKTDTLQVWVKLCEGTNRLVVKLVAQPGQRLAVRVDAPADKITVAPILNAAALGAEPMQARATLTGLGLPVPNAQVQFEVRGLGQINRRDATTSNAGVAAAYLSGFGAGAGKLRATSAGLAATVPITVVEKRTFSVKQRPESLRLEVGSGQGFALAIDLRDTVNDQDIVTLNHSVRPDSGSNPAGILVRSDFPLQGQIVPASKAISVSPMVTAVAPGRYTITTVATVTDKATGVARESFRTELPVEVVGPEVPTPLVLSKPLISPWGIAPSPSPSQVTFRTSIVGISKPPPVVFLDRVTSRGDLVSELIELRDDGKDPDTKGRDGIYSGHLALGNHDETEIYFRLRTEYAGKTVTSDISVFPITRLPLGSRPSTSPLVDTLNGQSKLFANEVVVGSLTGISPMRMRTIVSEVGNRLGLNPDSIKIAGYLPWIDVYLVEFNGDGTLRDVDRAITAFSAYSEIKYVSPNVQARLAGEWFFDRIGMDRLRASPARGLPELYGKSDVGIAIIDTAVDCSVVGNCAAVGTITASCQPYYMGNGATTTHGSRVAALAAGRGSAGGGIVGAEGGVARNANVFPFVPVSGSITDVVQAIQCGVVQTGAKIFNLSLEFADEDQTLESGICQAVCNGKLVVAAAGNKACGGDSPAYPASYSNRMTSCGCGTTIGSRMLSVGGTDNTDARGDACVPPDFLKSQRGDIYAPGWGFPFSGASNGTSWSTPLVSGCAALRGALQSTKGVAWDPTLVKARLINTSRIPNLADPSINLLDCHAAFAEPYDVVFVLDRSGSMGLPTATGVTRWAALKNAVTGFALVMPQNPPPNSRFGVTLFASEVLPNPLTGSLVSVDSTTLSGFVNNALNVTPDGATAMGLGLLDGLAKLTDLLRSRVIVLFTDGEQNISPKVHLDGCQFENTTPANSLCTGSHGAIRIITVGVGSPSGDYHSTLQNLATKNGGKFIVTDNGTSFNNTCTGTIDAVFDCAIAPALYGHSPQMVAFHSGTLRNTVSLPAFDLNKGVSQLLIKLSFSRSFEIPELMSILSGVRISKDGIDVTKNFEPVFATAFTNSILLKANFSYNAEGAALDPQPEGHYRIQLTAQPKRADLDFSAAIYADDHQLDMDWGISPVIPRVNQPFSPTVALKWRGRPVTDAKIEVQISQPGGDLSDLLAKHPQKVDVINRPDAGSPGYQKYLYLIENDPNFAAQLRLQDKAIPLAHQGDGRYATSYNPGTISGAYQISYRVSVEDPEFGKVQRTAVQSAYIRFGDIDLDKSAVSSIVRGNSVTIHFRPMTTYGRFIGPAQGSAFAVDGVGIKLSNVTDHQDGSYTLVLLGRPDSQVSIKLLGEEIYKGPAASINGKNCCREGTQR